MEARPDTPPTRGRYGRRLLATGSKEVAACRLGLSRSTVKHRLANARSTFGTETVAQLV
jgi:DNA-binding CsgD family transcriptional regulator